MENKSGERSLSLRTLSPHRHWTTSLCLVLLFSPFLGGSLEQCPSLRSMEFSKDLAI